MNRKDDFEPYWQDETDWLSTVEFLPTDDPEARIFASDIIGYLFGYAHLTNTRSLALVGDPDANAYELLFSFSSLHKDRHLQTTESNCDQKSFKPQWNRCELLQKVEAPDRLCIKTFDMRRRLG
jgi:hypothetical protein